MSGGDEIVFRVFFGVGFVGGFEIWDVLEFGTRKLPQKFGSKIWKFVRKRFLSNI